MKFPLVENIFEEPAEQKNRDINRSLILHENFNLQNDFYGHGSISRAD